MLGQVVKTNQVRIVPDLLDNPDIAPVAKEISRRRGFRSRIYIPIQNGLGEAIGVLDLSSRLTGYFTREHAAILSTYAEQAAIAIEHTRLLTEVAQHRDHLEDLVEERTRDLEAAQAQVLRQERLATLGQLTATVSHELRNPLGTIRTSLFALAKRLQDPELGIEGILERVERNIVRCNDIIEELLDYTRTPVMEKEPTALDAWLASVLDDYALPKGVRVQRVFDVDGDLWIYRERLRRAVLNVLANACQAIQGEPQEQQAEGQVTVATCRRQTRVEICVTDTGSGTAPEERERIFEPLYSTKSFGVGLGLPIVKQIMEQHGGGIEMTSVMGQGTTVTLWLPMEE